MRALVTQYRFFAALVLLLGLITPAIGQSFGPGPGAAPPVAGGASTITLGSTVLTLGSTTTTVAGLTLSGGTLSGTTTFPGAGTITAAGELGVGGNPDALFGVVGTYTTATTDFARISGTLASSNTGTHYASRVNTIFAPSGGSISQIVGFENSTQLNSTALAITSVYANYTDFVLGASYTGVISNFYGKFVADITPGGGSITNLSQHYASTLTNGNGITSGTVTNRQFRGAGITATAGAGGTLVNEIFSAVVPSGSAAGNTNYGLRITGNGGAASTNWAMHSASTAASLLTGTLTMGAPLMTMGYTVAGLPAGVVGGRAHVTNQLTACPVTGGALTGGGASTCPAFYNGAAWVGG